MSIIMSLENVGLFFNQFHIGNQLYSKSQFGQIVDASCYFFKFCLQYLPFHMIFVALKWIIYSISLVWFH